MRNRAPELEILFDWRFMAALAGLILSGALQASLATAAVLPDEMRADAGQHLPQQAGLIEWRGGPAAVQHMDAADAAAHLTALGANGESRHVLVQFSEPVDDAVRAALQESGITLLAYLGSNAFFAAVESPDPAGVAAVMTLVHGGPIAAEWKLAPAFVGGPVPQHAVVGAGADGPVVAAYIIFHPDVSLDQQGLPLMAQYNAVVRDDISIVNGLVIELPLTSVPALAAEDIVQWIEPPLPPFSEWLVNDSNQARTGANAAQAAPYNLTGGGISVLVYDGGRARATHVDFGGRLTTHDSSGLSGHATHVAGTIGGSGAASGGLREGMAPGVTLLSYGFQYDGTGIFLYSNPGDMQSDYQDAFNRGADISNNSIGTNTETNGFPCDIQGNYGVTDQVIDNIVRGNLGAPFRVVWANGNERQGNRCDIEGFGDYYSTAPPATAKNHITVGALNSNNDTMTTFSSWGPTDDGRMKPDVSGPGCQSDSDGGVTSPYSGSDTQYATLCGTSMASPTVCGLSALLMQDHRAQFGGSDMRNSTLKILLAHTAVDLGNAGPDYQFGYGSVRIVPAIDFMRTGDFEENSVSHGGTVAYTVNVAPGTPTLKVTLAWDDPAGTPNVVPSLINDLDLVVRDPNGVRSFPWTLNPSSPSSLAVRTARNSRDNIEQVAVSSPIAGTWTVEVSGFNVPQGPQPFSVCASPNLNPGGGCTPPAAPTGVAASDGTSCTSVTVSWSAVGGATGYQVFRNTTNNSSTAAQIASPAASPFVDTTATPGTTYFYWVKSVDACGPSGFSAADSGFAAATPAAPTGVSASDGASCTSVTVSWTASSGATTYEIWRNTVNDSGTASQIGTDTASPFADGTAVSGTTYFYWLRAGNACGTSGFSASDSGFVAMLPDAPAGVAASDSTSCAAVSVSWTAAGGATGYQIWRNTLDDSGTATQIGTDTVSPFDDTTAVVGTTYFYWVVATNACGTSPFSASDSGSRLDGTPAAPTGVSASDGTSCTTVTVSWSAVSGATGYEVWRNTVNDTATASRIGTPVASPFTDTTAAAGTTYFYWVKAVNSCGTSGFSAPDTGSRGTGAAPAAPTGVSATDNAFCDRVVVSWNASAGATGYQIFRGTNTTPSAATLIGTDTASPFDDTTGTPGVRYWYWVKATNSCGTSGFSNKERGRRASCP